MSKRNRKGQFKKKSRPVGYHSKPKKRKGGFKKKRNRSSSGGGMAAPMVGLAAAGLTVLGTVTVFNKTEFLAQDRMAQKVGISAATPAGVAFYGVGHVLRKKHPIGEAAFKGLGGALVVTDLARVLLEKFGVIASKTVPAIEEEKKAAGALPTPEEVNERRENDARNTREREDSDRGRFREREGGRNTRDGGDSSPRGTQPVDPDSLANRQQGAESSRSRVSDRVGSLLSLRRRAA